MGHQAEARGRLSAWLTRVCAASWSLGKLRPQGAQACSRLILLLPHHHHHRALGPQSPATRPAWLVTEEDTPPPP